MEENTIGHAAAGAIARTAAQILYPSDSKKDRERREKYVEENWRAILPQLAETSKLFRDRQIYNNLPESEKTVEKFNELIPPFMPFKEFLENGKTTENK